MEKEYWDSGFRFGCSSVSVISVSVSSVLKVRVSVCVFEYVMYNTFKQLHGKI